MIFTHKKVLVFGTGLSGISAVNLLNYANTDIVLYNSNANLDKTTILEKLPKEFKGEVILGKLPSRIIEQIDIVILSPGVPIDLEILDKIRNLNIPIWGEVELAYAFEMGMVIAITGTNGKTTTTTLVGEILKAHFDNVFVVGNIGTPYTQLVRATCEHSYTVAEISSFQLETIRYFRPNISAILNIAPDHLDRHHTMSNYIETKINITKNQFEEDICILNYDDKILRELGDRLISQVFYFSGSKCLETGIYLENNNIIYSDKNQKTTVCNIDELKIFGKHNYENVMAAIGIALYAKVPMDIIRNAIKEFVGVEHRIEYVATKNGVKYYNDSKGTNPEASMKAVESMQTPTLLIAGGYDKGSDYDEWIKSFGDKIKCLILLGKTKDKIAATAMTNGFSNIIMVDTLEEAVSVSSRNAKEGESVLLSPACASWGMFKNYEERGILFKECVNKL